MKRFHFKSEQVTVDSSPRGEESVTQLQRLCRISDKRFTSKQVKGGRRFETPSVAMRARSQGVSLMICSGCVICASP